MNSHNTQTGGDAQTTNRRNRWCNNFRRRTPHQQQHQQHDRHHSTSSPTLSYILLYVLFHILLHTEEEVGELCLRPDHSRFHSSQFGLKCHSIKAGGVDIARELVAKNAATRKALSHSSAMNVFKLAITSFAPLFIMFSPITSYADQIYSIHRTKTSAGFSLDIPLIMLTCSILKLFYWFGAQYDFPLLLQAFMQVGVHVVLLHVALTHRGPFGAQHSLNKPFSVDETPESYATRPFKFWQWRSRTPYWQFLVSFAAVLAGLQWLIGPKDWYVQLQGYVALGIEAILPIPQIFKNERNKSCRGFRVSVLINWMIGDFFKLSYFYMAEGAIPMAFKLCGLFQTVCDLYLGFQYWWYGEGPQNVVPNEKEARVS